MHRFRFIQYIRFSDSKVPIKHSKKETVVDVDENDHSPYQIIDKKYEEVEVSGTNRKYTGLTDFQKQIINTNTFDLAHPTIIPKSTPKSTFAGIDHSLTQISLGKAKIKGQNQVFLSEVDPYNIPADLHIRFDQSKQIRLIGSQINEPANEEKSIGKMKIEESTIEHRNMSQFMQKQFNGLNVRFKYGNSFYCRIDILVALLFIFFLHPIFQVLINYNKCQESIKEIEDERMKQVVKLKQKSFMRVLLENPDFR